MKKLLVSFLALLMLAAVPLRAHAAATLLPPGEQCFSAMTGLNGMVGTLGAITGGSGGTSGTYFANLTGGSGSSASASITVSGGAVTQVTLYNPGAQYVVGDVLSAVSGTIGGVTGFSIPVASISINSSLAGGKVFMYIPSTFVFKSTWFTAAATPSVQNTNPIALDQNGCAVIFGTGSYRQILQDSLGNTIWDQITTDTSATNNTFWAGISGGTPNVITVNDPGFNATDGSVIQFKAVATNTGAATLNPSGFGAIPIVKDTTAGPVSLVGGEIQQNNVVSVLYSAIDNSFTILNPVIQSASGSTAPLCGANGLSIQSDVSTPNTVLDVTITDGVSVSSTGAIINRANVAFNINFGTNGANGLDTGAVAGSTIYNLFLIDNGANYAGIASLSATNPLLPAGYSYKCRIGAAPTAVAGTLYGISILGNRAQLTDNLPNSGTLPFLITAASTGTCFTVFTAETFNVPPTNTALTGRLTVAAGTTAGVQSKQNSALPAVSATTPTAQVTIPFSYQGITPTTLGYCTNSVTNSLLVSGWVDSVNAQ